MPKLVAIISILASFAASEPQGRSQESSGHVVRVQIDDGAISPVTARFIERTIEEAASSGASAFILELDTPGGLVQSTHRIVRAILTSPIPVVVYVAPSGSRAASAGVFITLAGHVAAMAPGTHIGAAHPVQIGGGVPAPADTAAGPSVMEEKIVNDARAWARSLAELRGRNAEWAERAVSESVSITATEALDENVVDVVAGTLPELLGSIDGREVRIDNQPVILQTERASVTSIEPWWGERVLGAISDPNVAFILLIIGFYGLLFEFYSGGWGVPGTIGGLSLLLGFFGLAVLPINFVGLLLILLGLGLFVAEAFVPSFGALTVGGVVSLVLGGLMLVDSPSGVVEVSTTVVIPIAVATGLITFFLMGQAVQAHRKRVVTGAEDIIGRMAVVDETFEEEEPGRYVGMVRFHGELWRAESAAPLEPETEARITDRRGLTLSVERPEPS